MIVIDSSAIIAILFREPDAETLASRLALVAPGQRILSAANYVEAGTVLAGRHRDPATAQRRLDEFLTLAGVDIVSVDAMQARIALEARVRFGRGFGSGAKLNFGDCFAYALAKTRNAPLLFVGDDFSATDIVPALAT